MDRNIVTAGPGGSAATARRRAETAAGVRPVSPELLRRMAVEALQHTIPLGGPPVVWESYSEHDRITWLRCAWSLCTILGVSAGPLPDHGHPGLAPVPSREVGAAPGPRGLRGTLTRIVPRLRGYR